MGDAEALSNEQAQHNGAHEAQIQSGETGRTTLPGAHSAPAVHLQVRALNRDAGQYRSDIGDFDMWRVSVMVRADAAI